MFKRILLPLDGSKLAEAILPAARIFSQCFQATVLLFHVIEKDAHSTIHGQPHLEDAEQAKKYLGGISEYFSESRITCETHVHADAEKNVAGSIIRHCAEYKIDLVMLTAHGFGGLRDVFIGNIPQQVIAGGSTPVFFIKPKKMKMSRDYICRRILLPLDTSKQHEPALVPAMEIAKTCGSEIMLMCVIPTVGELPSERAGAGQLMPRAMEKLLDLAEDDAARYLKTTAEKCLAAGIVTRAETARGNIEKAIVGAIKNSKADLLVMATHGHTVLSGFWAGSLSKKLVFRSPVSVLLVRASGEETKR